MNAPTSAKARRLKLRESMQRIAGAERWLVKTCFCWYGRSQGT